MWGLHNHTHKKMEEKKTFTFFLSRKTDFCGNEKLKDKNGPNPFFFGVGGGIKSMVGVNLMATLLFWHGVDKLV